MSGTNVPQIVFTDTGAVVPSDADIVAGIGIDTNAAFGGGLNLAGSTPQGQQITSQAAMLSENYTSQTFLYNNIDPAYASGRMQDAIARIYFLERNPSQPTVIQVACGGAFGVYIPVGTLVKDPSGNVYQCSDPGAIGSGGSVTLSFSSQIQAPIPVPGSVTIYQAIPGWDTAMVVSGVVGNLTEDRAAFEARRQATVAANGAGFLPAIGGAVAKVAGVLDYYVTENPTGSPVTTLGVTLAANSLYVCVEGGTSADVAQAIWTKKNPGCSYTGGTSVTVVDSNSGYSYPYPSYVVKFQIPTGVATCFVVTIKNSSAVPSNAQVLIAAAILAAFNGQDGGTRARIGSLIFASRFYAAVALLGPWAQIISILLGTNGTPTASFTGVLAGTALTVSSVTGTIAIGQFVYGAGVLSGTRIASGSGSSWVVTASQTVSSEAMTSVAATNNDVQININQVPTLASADVLVVLV